MAEAEKKIVETKAENAGKTVAPETKAAALQPVPAKTGEKKTQVAEPVKQEQKQPATQKTVEKAKEVSSVKETKAKKVSAAGKARKKAAAPKGGTSRSSKPKARKITAKAGAAKRTRSAKAGTAKTAKRVEKSAKATTFKNVESIMTKTTYNFDKLAQEAQNTSKEGVEALVQSGSIFAKGFENILKTYVNIAQESAERNSQAVKALLGSRTLNEFTEAQSRLARENFDDFLNGVTKISELSVKVTTEALEPINDQFSKTIRKVSEAAAA